MGARDGTCLMLVHGTQQVFKEWWLLLLPYHLLLLLLLQYHSFALFTFLKHKPVLGIESEY